MLGFVDEPLPAVPHTHAAGRTPGALRARPVRVEPGGGAAVEAAARPRARAYRPPPAGGAPGGAFPAVLAQARPARGLPRRRRPPSGRAAAEPPLGPSAGAQARLGQVPLVAPG